MPMFATPNPRFKPMLTSQDMGQGGMQQPQQVLREAPQAQTINGRTPQQIAKERAMAEAMIGQGLDFSPVQHWTQGAARLANQLAGHWEESRLAKEEEAGRAGFKSKLDAYDPKAPDADRIAMALVDDPWASEGARGFVNAQMAARQPQEPTTDQRNYAAAQKDPKFLQHMMDLKRAGVTPLPTQIPGSKFMVDAQGNIVPGGQGQPSPQPMPPPAAPPQGPPQPAPGSGNPPAITSAAPTGTEAPQAQLVPLTGDALKRANLGNAPSNRQWAINPETGQIGTMEIPNSQTEIPGEIAARIGLSVSFLKDADYLVQQIEKGETSGLVNQAQLAMNMGTPGQLWRIASDGSDAMQRLLTGAGMPAAEAANYVSRFLPATGDSKATQLDKVRNLTRRLKEIVATAGRGRLSAEEVKRIIGVTEVGNEPRAPLNPAQAPSAPQPGTIEDGMRFKGGDPANPQSWEPVGGAQGGPQFAPPDADPYGIEAGRRQREEMNARHRMRGAIQ